MTDFDPTKGTRVAPAWNAAITILADRTWHPWTELVTAMTGASDILPKTADTLLYSGAINGHLTRKGRRVENRHVRLTDAGAARWLTA